MSNENLFKALGCLTRIQILKVLSNEEIHLTVLAKKIGLSKPVVSRHVRILEKAGLIRKRILGNLHLLSAHLKNLDVLLQPFIDENEVEISKDKSLFDALKQIPGVEVKKVNDNQYITSINGEKGYFIYEVDGKYPEVPIDEYKPGKNAVIRLKKLVPIEKKKIEIKVKKY